MKKHKINGYGNGYTSLQNIGDGWGYGHGNGDGIGYGDGYEDGCGSMLESYIPYKDRKGYGSGNISEI
jgi:hypothetical protein